MTTHEDVTEIKIRMNHLEAAHIDNTSKITTLISGFNTLNINLTSLVASINSAVKTTLISATFMATIMGGLWGYHTYMTSQIDNATTALEHSNNLK
jgi:hypothetical protein